VSWGVYEAHGRNPPFGHVLDAIAACGYEGTELGPYGYLPTAPDDLRRELSARGLGLGSSFVPLPLEDAGRRAASVESALAVARLLASQEVEELIVADDEDAGRAAVAGRVPADGSAAWTGAQWREAARTLQAVAEAVGGLGMRVVVHHHAGTFVETPEEIDRLLAETTAPEVGLLLDTGHLVLGGGDPLDLLRRHGPRVGYVHLKDVRGDRLAALRAGGQGMAAAWADGVFCPLGDGMVPFARVADALRSGGYAGWAIVEQDVVPDESGRLVPEPAESARRSRAYLAEACGL
jgi:inosose dehydratase